MIVKNCTLIQALSCHTDDSAKKAAQILRDKKQRRIIVVDSDNQPVGIISTTDMNNRVVADDKKPSEIKAHDIMSALFLTCSLDCDLNEIFQKMLKHETYFVPVTKEGKLFAILTYGEIVKRVEEVMASADN